MEKMQPFLVGNFHPFSCLSNIKTWGRRNLIHLKSASFWRLHRNTCLRQQVPSQFLVNNLKKHLWRVMFMWNPRSGTSFHSFNFCYLVPLLHDDWTSLLGKAAVSLLGPVGLVGLGQGGFFPLQRSISFQANKQHMDFWVFTEPSVVMSLASKLGESSKSLKNLGHWLCFLWCVLLVLLTLLSLSAVFKFLKLFLVSFYLFILLYLWFSSTW